MAADDIDIEFDLEEVDGPTTMYIEVISKRKGLLLGVVLLGIFAASIIAGITGPAVFVTKTASTRECATPQSPFSPGCAGVDVASNGTQWCGEIRNLTLLHQELSIYLRVAHAPNSPTFEKYLRVNVALWGGFIVGDDVQGNWSSIPVSQAQHLLHFKCVLGDEFCRDASLVHVPVLTYNDYRVCFSFNAPNSDTDFMRDVLVAFNYVNGEFSLFELWFRFIFVILALLTLAFFLIRQWRNTANWTPEQKWMWVVLIAQVGYNNPFFAISLMSRSVVGHVLEAVLTSTFVAVLLFFFFASFSWLKSQDHVYQGIRRRGIDTELIFKTILVVAIWIITIVQWSWMEVKYIADPAAHPATDSAYETIRMVFYVLCIMYVIWAVFTCAWAYAKIRSQALRVRMNFLFISTSVIVALTAMGLGLDFIDSVHSNAAEFTSFISLYNVYTIALTVLLSAHAGGPVHNSMRDLAVGVETDGLTNTHVISGDFEDDDANDEDEGEDEDEDEEVVDIGAAASTGRTGSDQGEE